MAPREHECLSWAAIGKSNWEITQMLDISEAPVHFHWENVTPQLGMRGRVCAVTQAIRLDLINPT